MAVVVDADAHVIETEATWRHMRGQPPRLFSSAGEDGATKAAASHWYYEGSLVRTTGFDPTRTGTPQEARVLADLPRRLADLDRLGIDLQVIFSTFFLRMPTKNPQRNADLCRAYNAWMAETLAPSEGRLRFAAVLPLTDTADALAELEATAAEGASAIHFRGIEDEVMLADARLFPIYARAEELDLPICIHSGNANHYLDDLYRGSSLYTFSLTKLPVMAAFSSLGASDVATRFPRLRFAFVEAGASWLPNVMHDLHRRYELGQNETPVDPATFLGEHNFYVTCQPGEDLPYLVDMFGPDHLIVGSDYGHADVAAELEAVGAVGGDVRLTPEARSKIVSENPMRLYALT